MKIIVSAKKEEVKSYDDLKNKNICKITSGKLKGAMCFFNNTNMVANKAKV